MPAPSYAQTPLQIQRLLDQKQLLQSIEYQIELSEGFWKTRTEGYHLDSQLDAVKECEEIQRFFSLFLRHRMQHIKELPASLQREALNHFIPFNSHGQLNGFLEHFFRCN